MFARVEELSSASEARILSASKPEPFEAGREVELPQVPFGTSRVLRLELRCGADALSKVLYVGTSQTFDVEPDKKVVVSVTMRPVFEQGSTANVRAFPGAEGFGAFTVGGRAGQVLSVTNLNDEGVGSLRFAVEQPGPRIIVFRVAGVLELKSTLVIQEPFLTIAGQSAPEDGILITGQGVRIETSEVILRHLRIRPNLSSDESALVIGTGSGDSRPQNIAVDHCSLGWSRKATIVLSRRLSPRNVTFSWNLLSESFQSCPDHGGCIPQHVLSTNGTTHISFYRNAFIHGGSRNVEFLGGDISFENNLFYNYSNRAFWLAPDETSLRINAVQNLLVKGPNTGSLSPIVLSDAADPQLASQSSVFLQGNTVREELEDTPPDIETVGDGLTRSPEAIPLVKSATVSAAVLLELLSEGAGATRPVRDAVDLRSVSELTSKTNEFVGIRTDPMILPRYRSTDPIEDSDNDGMPDAWERTNGFDPSNPEDAAQDADGDGYTNIEEYLEQTAAPSGQCP